MLDDVGSNMLESFALGLNIFRLREIYKPPNSYIFVNLGWLGMMDVQVSRRSWAKVSVSVCVRVCVCVCVCVELTTSTLLQFKKFEMQCHKKFGIISMGIFQIP